MSLSHSVSMKVAAIFSSCAQARSITMRGRKGTAMRITAEGQVTIPADIREKAGLLPNTEVEFAYDGNGDVLMFRTDKPKAKTRGEELVEHMIEVGRKYPRKMTTDEIMALTRGED